MYVSDYGFAADPSAWSTRLSSYSSSSITTVNWMYSGFYYEWTITRNASSSDYMKVFMVYMDGNVSLGQEIGSLRKYKGLARPAFYLTSSVTYAGGSGKINDPIRIV